MSTESPVDTKPEPDDYITTLERARELGRSAVKNCFLPMPTSKDTMQPCTLA